MQGTTQKKKESEVHEEFQSTFPMRKRLYTMLRGHAAGIFQSTFPMQGTTKEDELYNEGVEISIHVPSVGNDGRASFR